MRQRHADSARSQRARSKREKKHGSRVMSYVWLIDMEIDNKTTKKTRRNIYKPTRTSTEHTLDTTGNIKRNLRKTA